MLPPVGGTQLALFDLSPSEARLAWKGRVWFGEGRARLGFPATGFALSLDGRVEVDVEAEGPEAVAQIEVEGSPPRVVALPQGHSRHVLEGRGKAWVIKRTDAWQGTVAITKVAGQAGPAPAPLERRVLFVGDSITSGGGADECQPGYPDASLCSSGVHAFGWVTGELLGADVHLASYGGRGLIRDWQGLDRTQIVNAPEFFERALPDDPAALWDHASWQPHAVVVNLGTNDFNTGIPEESVWVGAMTSFCRRIRKVHPGALILASTSPMFSPKTENGDAAKKEAQRWYLASSARILKDEGDSLVDWTDFSWQPGTELDAHPTTAQQRAIAGEAAQAIASRLGWSMS